MNYADELAAYGMKEAVKVAIVFYGKKVHIRHNIRRLGSEGLEDGYK